MALYGITLLTAIPSAFYNRAIPLRALLKIPVLIRSPCLRALLGVKKNRSGIHSYPKGVFKLAGGSSPTFPRTVAPVAGKNRVL